MITDAVRNASPGRIAWESHQTYNMTRCWNRPPLLSGLTFIDHRRRGHWTNHPCGAA